MDHAIEYINSTIDFLNGGIKLLCTRNEINNPYLLGNYTCVDGKIVNCNSDYCHGRGEGNPCCKVQRLIARGQSTISQLQITTVGSSSVLAGYGPYIVAAVIVVLLTVIFFLIWELYKAKHENKQVPCQKLTKEKGKDNEDNDSGCSSTITININDEGALLNPDGSFNKKKILSPPEDTESRINTRPDHVHQLYLRNERQGNDKEDFRNERLGPVVQGNDKEETVPLTLQI